MGADNESQLDSELEELKILVDREAENLQESDPESDAEGKNKPRRLKKYKEVLEDRIEAKQIRREERVLKRIEKEKQSLLRKHEVADPYFEDQAELGSDNEENDGDVKKIHDSDSDEDEEGLDEHLKDIIHFGEVGEGDEDEVQR